MIEDFASFTSSMSPLWEGGEGGVHYLFSYVHLVKNHNGVHVNLYPAWPVCSRTRTASAVCSRGCRSSRARSTPSCSVVRKGDRCACRSACRKRRPHDGGRQRRSEASPMWRCPPTCAGAHAEDRGMKQRQRSPRRTAEVAVLRARSVHRRGAPEPQEARAEASRPAHRQAGGPRRPVVPLASGDAEVRRVVVPRARRVGRRHAQRAEDRQDAHAAHALPDDADDAKKEVASRTQRPVPPLRGACETLGPPSAGGERVGCRAAWAMRTEMRTEPRHGIGAVTVNRRAPRLRA